MSGGIRAAAVAGSWYPADAVALQAQVDGYLSAPDVPLGAELVAIVAPHAGIMYSGPIAGHAYAALRGGGFDTAVLVGPSHFVGFEGVASYDGAAFACPLGDVPVARELVERLEQAGDVVRPLNGAHAREHALEMQLPFLKRVLPGVRIVPLVMGRQSRETISALAGALGSVLRDVRAVLVASSDLSHYFDAETAERLDARVLEAVGALDADGLVAEMERYPEHERGRYVACGGGPAAAVLAAAKDLGATWGRVLARGDSGDVSGDKRYVVGYLAAVAGRGPVPIDA